MLFFDPELTQRTLHIFHNEVVKMMKCVLEQQVVSIIQCSRKLFVYYLGFLFL